MIATIICATIVYVDLTALYISARTHTTIENTMQPVFYVPFPATAICTLNRIDIHRLETQAMDKFLGVNASATRKEVFRQFFTAVSDVHFNDFKSLWRFFGNATLAAEVGQLDDLNVRQVLEYVNVDCAQIFVECSWRSRPQNCCEIFELQRTELGICWIFNSAVSAKLRQRAVSQRNQSEQHFCITRSIHRRTTSFIHGVPPTLALAPAWMSICTATNPTFVMAGMDYT